jgi:NitT/TauT family transport system substrate-binding protein
MTRPRPIGVLALTLALALAGCVQIHFGTTSSPSPSGLQKVTLMLGYQPDVQFAPFYLAQQGGYYADAGLDVTIEQQKDADLIRLVASGIGDVGVADATDVMISRTSGIPVKYVSTLYDRFPVAIIGPKGKVPASPAGLAGLRTGTPGRYGSSWAALLALLSAAGLTDADVTIREYPQYNQWEGLLHGDVDLITGFRNNEPLRLEAAGMAVDLLTIDETAPLPGPGVIAGDALLSTNPDLVRRFVAATARAQAAVIADPEVGLRAARVVVPTINEDPETALAVLRATVELWEGSAGFGNGLIDVDRWTAGYAVMRRIGFIDGSVPVNEMIDPTIAASG